ncbi:Cu-oxidase-domain-containing protein [Guyanagaster necrorhizus]|uniref:Cu-oxidase-domain-containing protein n=1 Tax=Guyanagaster necrorhizus TaxID=856835 RepID=A0A9P8AV15_9AGAR|nr:Cu-oxidase-domain-containing protein [Guyanagaster necrorhizus MCA 3950]KAG7448641.1 Cu-oxidase-domain-containing protein [Guyanagaster necrorhizus MCA 3950]
MFSLLASAVVLTLLRPHPAAGVAVAASSEGGGKGEANLKEFTIDLVNNALAPDGFLRSTIVANGTYPGPPILVNKNDILSITLHNDLVDPSMRLSTSLDLDGIFFTTENLWNEGSPFVTTCPIGPGASYTYIVDLSEFGQTGTFWYHSQLSIQYIDGFRGPLIVYDPEDPLAHLYDVDDESTIIQLGDWWHNSTLPMLQQFEATGIIPVSDSGTVNGFGRFNGGPEIDWSVINVVPGKRYRFRIINESARNVFTFSIDKHSLTVIEADGVELTPSVVDTVQMLAGQRYSVVVHADQRVDNYWINAPYVGGNALNNLNQNATLSRAILRYAGAPRQDPTAPMTQGPVNGVPLIEGNLRPLVPESAPPADVNITLEFVNIAGKAIWNVNNVSYVPPVVPTLMKVIEGDIETSDFNETENTFILPANKTIQITFPPNDDDDAHPIHMHGMNFWLIKSNSTDEINTKDPIKRDIVAAGAAGAMIRFRTDKPGPWFFHCHIFWHLQAGLATVMLADPGDAANQIEPDAVWDSLCPAYDALFPAQQ